MKRIMTILLTLTMIVSLAACGNETKSDDLESKPTNEVKEDVNQTEEKEEEKKTEEKEEASNSEPEEIVDIVYFTSSAKYKESYDVIAKKIEENLNVRIDIQVVPDEQYATLLKTKLSTNEVPDIFDYNTPVAYSVINARENCVDLSKEAWVERLVNPGLVMENGKLYGMPRESSSFYPAFYYNKKVFNDLGLEEPTTLEELYTVLDAIKEAGITPIHMANKESWTTQIYMTNTFTATLGKDKAEEVFYKLRNNKLKHADVPEFVEVLNTYMTFYDKGYVNKDHMSATYDDSQDAVGKGEAAMMLNGEWVVSGIQTLHPDAEIGAFAIPVETGLIGSGAFVQGMFIPKASENVEMAKKVLELWSQPEYLNIFFEENPASPAFIDVDPGEVPECVTKMVNDYIAKGNAVTEYNAMFEEVGAISGDYLWNYYLEMVVGDKTAEEVLEAWDLDVEDYMTSKGHWE